MKKFLRINLPVSAGFAAFFVFFSIGTTDLYAQEEELSWPLQKMEARGAWAIEEGNDNVVVAVIDSGIDNYQETLLGHIFTPGKDFINNDNDPAPWDYNYTSVSCDFPYLPDNYTAEQFLMWKMFSHGTAMSSVVVGQGSEYTYKGLAHGCKVMGIRIGDES
ncbi:MAG: S8 family serine peptidase, partial [PVC group bacterium]